jgi:hypothetical protein
MLKVSIENYFPTEQRRKYVSRLQGQVGLTRIRAEYFVRLWGYLLFKQQEDLRHALQKPLTELDVPEGFISCTHQEAADLFYYDKERGSERAAGMMIDNFVNLGLIDKQFDGNSLSIRIRPQAKNLNFVEEQALAKLEMDIFNPRTDAIPIAHLLIHTYGVLKTKNTLAPQQIARKLRVWAQRYIISMRVLRRTDNHHPVGFYVIYPTGGESEENFFLPPSKSIYLTSELETDPVKMANQGDLDCTSVFLRSFSIDSHYMQRNNLCLLLKDIQNTLRQMQSAFPSLWDLYSMALNPSDEKLASALSFQKTGQPDPQLRIHWIYTSVDHFVQLDIDKALSKLEFA